MPSVKTRSELWKYLEANLEIFRSGQDSLEFLDLFERMTMSFRSWFLRKGAPEKSAEDLAVETGTKIILKIESFEDRGSGSFLAWSFKIAENNWNTWARKEAEHGTVGGSDSLEAFVGTSDENDEESECDAAVGRAFLRLTEREQTLLDMNIIQGLPYKDVGEKLKISTAAARQAAARARARFREECQDEEELQGRLD